MEKEKTTIEFNVASALIVLGVASNQFKTLQASVPLGSPEIEKLEGIEEALQDFKNSLAIGTTQKQIDGARAELEVKRLLGKMP